MSTIEKSYELAKEQYAAFGIDTDAAIEQALEIPISLHCWQADDNLGFEPMDEVSSGGGILVTGNHPGRARGRDAYGSGQVHVAHSRRAAD